ncbi:6,7-dimethyl-8-ribityllumazine synthase [Ignicoccus islandicus DSM 13165]|uniref:6,7-dimethyl-8-ribityllumazine synthase n=2 Tax=Ignicoccus islandicus TaxID=54259 RepID=A0A0U3E8C8_9CREN|nr:6,7-dimethyl-8-ribityllumazine synthase [Ignicoccus islandicus]ALU11614.1 6,7-dimethyl-8-ribityllumazine synthase [Ignicoccus islandicus DSM 13165]
MKIGIVVAEFNYDITYMMKEKAVSHAQFLGVDFEVVYVPGVFETPLATKVLLERDDIDAVAVIGAVIKGETDHDQVVAHQAARKLLDLSLEYNKPVALGIIGPNATREQATERIEEYARRAVEAAVKMVRRLNNIKE